MGFAGRVVGRVVGYADARGHDRARGNQAGGCADVGHADVAAQHLDRAGSRVVGWREVAGLPGRAGDA